MAANTMFNALSGLNTFSTAISVVSDNIANANTTGWKSNTVDFGDLVSGLIPTREVNTTAQGTGSTVLGVNSDFGNGSEIQTGNWSNLMIQGNGFFEVQDNSGTTPVDYYTRDGSFQVYAKPPSTTTYLTDMNGNQVQGQYPVVSGGTTTWTDGSIPIDTTMYSNFTIDKFGNINASDSSNNSVTIGKIKVSTFPNPNGLIRDGENMYTPGASAGTATPAAPGVGGAGTLVSGALEGSNVDLTAQMVDLITYQADYQANSKSIETANTLLQTMVNMMH